MSGAPSSVLSRVEGELRAVWSLPPPPGETPKSRACTRNLVLVAGSPQTAQDWASIVDDVLQYTPARAIVVGLDPDAPDGLDATSTAVCYPGQGGGPAICSERIQMTASGVMCARLASCVQSLCVADVPTTLVWLGRVHADDPAFAPLALDADRVILDASQGSLSGLAHMVRWASARGAGARPGVADLTWTRLAPWHELCARMFDEPRLRDLAARIHRVRIVQAPSNSGALGAEGGLLLGWLATRLGWKATSLAGRLRLLRPNDGTVQAQLVADPAAQGPRGSLVAIQIEASQGTGSEAVALRGSVERRRGEANAALWQLDVTQGGEARHIEQHVELRANEPARLLERTLRRPAFDLGLSESVAWADELLGEELACA